MKGNRTGRGNFKEHPENINKGNVPKGVRVAANEFKDWAFNYWKDNKEDFEDVVKSDQKTMMEFMKMLSGFVPKEVDLGNKDGEPLIVKWLQ